MLRKLVKTVSRGKFLQILRCESTSAKLNTNKKEKVIVDSPSFAMNIYRGKFVADQLYPYPKVLTEDQKEMLKMLVDPTDKFFKEVNDPFLNDKLCKVDDKSLQGLKTMGAFGLQIPTNYNGLGLNNTQYARMVECVGQALDMGVGITLGAYQSIGLKGILLYGTETQKSKYLPDLATGQNIAAFCLTEPSAGSDAASIKCRAVPDPTKQFYTLNGSKIWISNGGYAEIFTVFAKTPSPHDPDNVGADKVSAFIVERKFGGVTSGPPEQKMGIKASNTAEVYFDNVKIPAANMLGEPGQGFKIAMNILNNGRFGMAAALAGTMKSCIKQAVGFARDRTQFGDKIYKYGLIQEKLARMAACQYVTESVAYALAGSMDAGAKDYQVEAAISKVMGSEYAWYVVDEAIQINGGMGYMQQTGLERVMRDLRIFRIFEGTNDILKLFIALTGLQYAGGHLSQLQKALKNPLKNGGLLTNEVIKRTKRMMGIHGLDSKLPSNLAAKFPTQLRPSLGILENCVAQFGIVSERMLIRQGKNLAKDPFNQFGLLRLAECAIDVYGMAAGLSRCRENFVSSSSHKPSSSLNYELTIMELYCSLAQSRINRHLGEIRADVSNFKRMKQISEILIESGEVPSQHPLNF